MSDIWDLLEIHKFRVITYSNIYMLDHCLIIYIKFVGGAKYFCAVQNKIKIN